MGSATNTGSGRNDAFGYEALQDLTSGTKTNNDFQHWCKFNNW